MVFMTFKLYTLTQKATSSVDLTQSSNGFLSLADGDYTILLTACVALIVFCIINAFLSIFENNQEKQTVRAERALCCLLTACLLYWIEGIITAKLLFNELLAEEIISLTVQTHAFIGFIVSLVVSFAYYFVKLFFLHKLEPQIRDFTQETVLKQQITDTKDIANSADLITKYKALLDEGAITPEEYYKIKAGLLG